MKTCYECRKEKLIDEFGFNKAMEDGRSLYCLLCRRKKTQQQRDRRREVARRACAMSTPEEQVKKALRRGKETRTEIRKSTRMTWDVTCDALAELALVRREIYSKRINGDAHFFLKAA